MARLFNRLKEICSFSSWESFDLHFENKKLKEENERLKKDNDNLEAENEKLKEEIEQMKKTKIQFYNMVDILGVMNDIWGYNGVNIGE
ncbi:MAG: hypothetical protein RML94_09375 [Bacteroidia bacterium]|nr:hypothetical protein [Bacteroidia bacterium]